MKVSEIRQPRLLERILNFQSHPWIVSIIGGAIAGLIPIVVVYYLDQVREQDRTEAILRDLSRQAIRTHYRGGECDSFTLDELQALQRKLSPRFDPRDYGLVRFVQGLCETALGLSRHNAESFERALVAFDDATRIWPDATDDANALLFANRGAALLGIAMLKNHRPSYVEAIRWLESAVTLHDRKLDGSRDIPAALLSLGSAHRGLAILEKDRDRYLRGIEITERAAELAVRDRDPRLYANIQAALCESYGRQRDLAHLEQARDACTEAVRATPANVLPCDHAQNQVELAESLVKLAYATRKRFYIDRALEACQTALTVCSLERCRIEYGFAQDAIGTVYIAKGRLLEPDQITEKAEAALSAIAALNQALTVRRVHETPDLFASTHANLARAYMLLADVRDTDVNVSLAATACQTALNILPELEDCK